METGVCGPDSAGTVFRGSTYLGNGGCITSPCHQCMKRSGYQRVHSHMRHAELRDLVATSLGKYLL